MSIRLKWLPLVTVLVIVLGLTFLWKSGPSFDSLPSFRSPFSYSDSLSVESQPHIPTTFQNCGLETTNNGPTASEWDSSRFLNGPPTKAVKNNLKEGQYYITSWATGGLTKNATALLFSRVFNITSLRQALRLPLVEWTEAKLLVDPTSVARPKPSDLEPIGCWSMAPTSRQNPLWAGEMLNNLHLDVSYTRIPDGARVNASDPRNNFSSFSNFASYLMPNGSIPAPRGGYPLMQPAERTKHTAGPDGQLACFDMLYYMTSSQRLYEWEVTWSPMWKFVGKHMRFTDALMDLARGYLAKTFEVEETNIPPFIAIHMRRTDFADPCKGKPGKECLISFSTVQSTVNGIQAQLQSRYNKQVDKLLLFSDEEDPAFWSQARSLGFSFFDHKQVLTVEKYGEWYPTIIDIAAHSLADAFIGTAGSTFSLFSAKRVEYWQGGPTVLIKWPS